MIVRVGTSGFAYKEWKGTFYPPDLKSVDMLKYYGERLGTVEINNTFYRMPKASTLEGWRDQVPETFQFVLKASQRITHHRRLKDVDEEIGYWAETSATLGVQLGPTLFQLPPNFKRDLPRLASFLEGLPAGIQPAFEFRHPSWSEDDAVFTCLTDHEAAWVIADSGEDDLLRIVRTAPFAYARLRRVDYTDAEVEQWASTLAGLGADALYVFFKHEDGGTGPVLAQRFADLAGGGSSTPK